jgi:nicotinamide-nucleotide amidase
MRVEVLAVGTELLLGQVADTNSSWIGEQLAAAGLDCLYQAKVGDNRARIKLAIESALDRCDALIVCGGLGPTVDDITRDVIADVMGVQLVRDQGLADTIESMFVARGRAMSANNLRQADVPAGATIIAQRLGTAPGLICPLSVGGADRVIYALPGVPYEMQEMLTRAVLPDLLARSGETAMIVSRSLKTWGMSESAVDELLLPTVDRLDQQALSESRAVPTIAYLASGIEGLKVRLTVKDADSVEAAARLDEIESAVREVLGVNVFGVDDDTMESVVGELLMQHNWSIGLAESLTAGLAGARCGDVAGASRWFRGSVVSYATEVKRSLLKVGATSVVSDVAAREMADGARRQLGSDVGLSFTGVAGPETQDDQPVGTVFVGVAMPGVETEAIRLMLPGDRQRVRGYAVISGFDALRRRL